MPQSYRLVLVAQDPNVLELLKKNVPNPQEGVRFHLLGDSSSITSASKSFLVQGAQKVIAVLGADQYKGSKLQEQEEYVKYMVGYPAPYFQLLTTGPNLAEDLKRALA